MKITDYKKINRASLVLSHDDSQIAIPVAAIPNYNTHCM